MNQFSSDEFLKSFLEEAVEYLRAIVRCLLRLEESLSLPPGAEQTEEVQGQLNELLRALHSLKGISGMVGLDPAAALCHAMESLLRPVQQGQQAWSAEAANLLIDSARLLEAVVQTVRDPSLAMPDSGAMLERLEAFARPPGSGVPAQAESPAQASSPAQRTALPPEIAVHLGEGEWKKMATAAAAGSQVALVYYVPSGQQAQAGRNVNQVRDLLNQQARLIKAVPLIQDGVVRFAFVVACQRIPALPELADLDWQPVTMQPPAPPVSDPPHSTGVVHSQPAAAAIRVDLERMNELMQLVGDLVVTRSRISEALPRLRVAAPAAVEGLQESAATLERQVRNLRKAIMRARLAPLSEVFSRMPLAVRDLARATGKPVQLSMEGGGTEIDKALIDRLVDPLMHIVRNAATHGIEPPEQRALAGKPQEGRIRLVAWTEGDHVLISIEDDGAGVDADRVKTRARAQGLLAEDRALSNQDLLEIMCLPGFSTQDSADMGAGRGMGMNAAAATIAELGGRLVLETHPGQGTRFTIQLPLTLTIIDAFIVEAGGERYAVPQSVVNEVIEISPEQVTRVTRHDLVPYRGAAIPLVPLQRVFGLAQPLAPRQLGLVVGQDDRQAALVVERVLGLRETVVRPLLDPLVAVPGISGVTELGDGSVVLILNCDELVHDYSSTHRSRQAQAAGWRQDG